MTVKEFLGHKDIKKTSPTPTVLLTTNVLPSVDWIPIWTPAITKGLRSTP
jgi:hypothetical protein